MKRANPNAWKKGQSGNPGGRLKTTEDVKEALRLAVPEAITALRNLLNHEDGRIVVAAAVELLARGLGRVPERRDEPSNAPAVVVNFVPLGTARPGHKPAEVDRD